MTQWQSLLDVIFPIKCIRCGRSGEYLCEECMARVNFLPQQRCAVCNGNAMNGETHMRCRKAYVIDGVWAMASNQGVMKKLIHRYKYGYAEDLGRLLASMLISCLPGGLRKFDLLVPVPLFSLRQRWRGFNQAENLTELINKRIRVSHKKNILVRVKAGRPQASIRERKERLTNLKDVFKLSAGIDRKWIKGKSILLVDDVATTGTTLRRAAIPLKRAGAGVVWGVVLAR